MFYCHFMGASMTTSTKSNEVRINIVMLITIFMMYVRFTDFFANFALLTSSIKRHFLKPTMTMFEKWRLITFAKNIAACFRTKTTSFIFVCRLGNEKFFSAGFASLINMSYLRFIETIKRAKSTIRMFKSRLEKFKFNTTRFTVFFNSGYNESFISTIFRAKTFYLIRNSEWNRFKFIITYSTRQLNSFFSECMLTFSRTKKVFMFFEFIGMSLKRLIALRTLCNHRYHNTRREKLNQPLSQGG